MVFKKKELIDRWYNDQYLEMIKKEIETIKNGNKIIENVDLAGIVIGPSAVMAIKDLNFYKVNFLNVDLSHCEISGSINNAYLNNVNFFKAKLDRSTMFKAEILNCNFSYSKIIVNMDDAVCEDCNFASVQFNAGTLGLEYGGRRVKFKNCNFTNAIFNRVEFRASKFINCNFENTKFINCDFRGVKLEGLNSPHSSQFEKMDIPEWATV